MIEDTADHVAAVRDAATKWDNSDPVGSALTITGAAAGGVGGLAGSYAGIQHYGDFKKMYTRIANRLGKKSADKPSGGAEGGSQEGGDGTNSGGPTNPNDAGAQSRGNAGADNDGAASNPARSGTVDNGPQGASGGQDIDGGISTRIDNLGSAADTNAEANAINKAIEAKASAGGIDKAGLNSRLRTSGRSTRELKQMRDLPEGALKEDAQKDYLNFKNNVANDAVQRAQNGQPQASGYDKDGNPTGDAPGPQNQAAGGDVVRTQADPNATAAPDGDLGGGSLAPDVNAAPVTNASGDITTSISDARAAATDQVGGIIARGRAALANLRGGVQVPAQGGGSVQGLAADAQSAGANAASRLQQGLADQTAGARSALAHPNTGGGQPSTAGNAQGSGVDGGTSAPGGGGDAPIPQGNPSTAGTVAADGEDAVTTASRAISTGSKVASGLADASDAADAIDLMAGMAGPAAPIVGLIGGLISLGTTIAGLFHHKPPPKKEAPPPAQQMSIGGNLSSTQSMGGAGIF
jgi:hypothetical protein